VFFFFQSFKALEALVFCDVSNEELQEACKVPKTNMGEAGLPEELRMLSFQRCELHAVEDFVSLCSVELRWLRLNLTAISFTSIQGSGIFRKFRLLRMADCWRFQHLPECIGNSSSLLELVLAGCECLDLGPSGIYWSLSQLTARSVAL